MAKKTTRKRALQKARPAGKMTGATTNDGMAVPSDLGPRLKADRVNRRMTWPAYAAFLGVKLSTVYKIAKGRTTRPHELTTAQIEERIQLPVTPAPPAEGAADAVVSSGQRHPERPEN